MVPKTPGVEKKGTVDLETQISKFLKGFDEEMAKNIQKRFFGKKFLGASIGKVYFPAIREGKDPLVWIDHPDKFLIVLGPPGTGKTYFCSALVGLVYRKVSTIRVYNERDLLDKLRISISQNMVGSYLQYLHYMIDDDIIIIDDIGSSRHNEWHTEVITDLVDFRYEKCLPTIFTSNLTEDEFYKIYGARVAGRLFAKENTVMDFSEMPDWRKEGF